MEPASTTYKDWTGTAAAENSMITASGDLHELAGLDRDRWSILGIDAHAHSHGADPRWTVHVYAFDRQGEEGAGSYEELKALEARRGSVPVKDVQLHNVSLDDVIRCMKVIQIQLLTHNFTKLDIVELGDHPEQD